MAGVIEASPFETKGSDVPELRSDNYKAWKEAVLLHLGIKDIDLAIRKPQPEREPEVDDELFEIDYYEQWERSNRLCMMFIKSKLPPSIRGSVEGQTNVKALLQALDEQFASSEKANAMTLIMKLTSQRLTTVTGVREHIMRMRDIVAQLKGLEVDISESFLVYFILNTLPVQYGPFKISYNTHKERWSLNELMAMCVQEENRLAMDQTESVHMAEMRLKKGDNEEGKQFNKSKNKGKGKFYSNFDIKKGEN